MKYNTNTLSHISNITSKEKIPYKAGEKVRITLIVQLAAVWTSVRSFAVACKLHELVDLNIVLLPFEHPYLPEDTSHEMQDCLKKDGLSFFHGETYNIDMFQPHVVMLPNPYEITRSKPFQTESLTSRGYRVAYIPYGIEIGSAKGIHRLQFNLDCHNKAWRIFAYSDKHKKRFEKHCDSGGEHVIVTGHPKFDAQFDYTVDLSLITEMKKKIGDRKVILWTPHFSVNELKWSTYKIYGEFILEQTACFPNLFFIIRPHPLFFGTMIEDSVWDKQDEINFRKRCQQQENLFLDEGSDYLIMFSLTDALMSDVASFLLEFLPTKKPIIYLNHPEGDGVNDTELASYFYTANCEQDIKQFIEQVSKGEDPKENDRVNIVSEYVPYFDGKAGTRICDYILNELAFEGEQNLTVKSQQLQKKSNVFWENVAETFLAPPAYYELKKTVLMGTLNALPQCKTALDIGCGDGHFTSMIAKEVDTVEAYDMSSTQIAKAIKIATENDVSNINYTVKDISEIPIEKSFDIVFCMGITSCLLDDVKYERLLDKIKLLVNEGGYLILNDSLSLNETEVLVCKEGVKSIYHGYVAKYRYVDDYLNAVGKRGFDEVAITDLRPQVDTLKDNRVNQFFVFQRKSLNAFK